ncbi:allantoate amidohydrolase [Haloferula helveola]|uniref:Allantoate amidohydrolase n=1 Tax=Haloferula helveola TaxID=490095 RepID=A0ABN6H8P4_9BACT|nr:allantoate amidohydrolase [Haloferula helveola]
MVATKAGISIDRLGADLRALAEIGRAEDGGVYRMAFSEADMVGKSWLEEKMKDAGLETSRDGACNVIGKLRGTDPDAPALLVGSHIDTVPCAGILDGTLGVLTGLECLRVIVESGRTPACDIELVAFSDEEGRFGGMFGSQAFAGQITPDTIHSATDPGGVRLEDAMKEVGLDPWQALQARRDPKTVGGYLELHIEQGPVLSTAEEQVAVVDAITGLFKWSITFSGEPNHAGTTPMPLRRDAFMGVADFAHEIPRILDENGSDCSRATIGRVELTPGSPNTVPGEAVFTIDVRDTDETVMNELAGAIRKALAAIARRRGLRFTYHVESWIKPVACHPRLVEKVDAAAQAAGVRYRHMESGAAHDAQIMASVCPVAMIFVPSVDGKSHSPAEWTPYDDIEAGAKVMLGAIERLAFGES